MFHRIVASQNCLPPEDRENGPRATFSALAQQEAPDNLYDKIADLLASMQPIGEDMVRGIAVRHVLHGFGAALRLHPSRQQDTLRRLHQKSRPTETWPVL